MNVERIRSHFAERLAAAEVVHRPCTHVVITEVLPPDLYDEALATQPFRDGPGRCFGDPSWTSRLTFKHHYNHRFHHDLRPGHRLIEGSVWADIGDAFSDPEWLGPVLRTRFAEYFEFRFGDIDAIEEHRGVDGFWSRLRTETFVQRHQPGFQLDAHTDIPSRIATCIVNLPTTSGTEFAGTQFLEPLDPTWRCSGNRHHPLGGFRVALTIPYAPNTAVVFVKTRHSWHAVAPEASEVPGGRLGLQVQLYEPDTGVVHDLTAPDLVRNGQFRPLPLTTRTRVRVGSLVRSLRSRPQATKRAAR